LVAWSPDALAFPPCPRLPLTLQPSTSIPEFSQAPPPWFLATYAIVETAHSAGLPGSGVCTDRAMPTANRRSDSESNGVPVYAPSSRFGVIALPEFPAVAVAGLRVEYGLQFTADAAPLPTTGDWFDLAQLEFLTSKDSGAPGGSQPAVYYRIRKHQTERGQTLIEVIEARASGESAYVETTRSTAVVARVVQDAELAPAGSIVHLRWTQAVRPNTPQLSDPALGARWIIDTTVEVIGPNGQALYRQVLPGKWANGLSIGALDYNVANHTLYDNSSSTELREVWMSAYRLPD
jgi:hypothetical protein